MKFKKILFAFVFFSLASSLIADSGIYICGHFRRDRTKTVTAVKESGFTFGILFNVHVETDGTLTTDGEVICKNGEYVFDRIIQGYNSDKSQVDYVDDVNSLLSGRTSLLRLEHCIGGWTNYAYQNITKLVNAQGTGTSSILYRNFKALKDAIPAVIAINNDIEHDYDAASQAKFHIMLYDIGFKTTIAPYTNKSYWENFVQLVEDARPGAVDRNYLQCYGGGAGNNPANWKIKNIPIYGSRDIEANPGLSHQEIVNTMTNWKNNAGIVGGFYWNYNYDRDLKKFSAPINEVFGGGEIADRGRIVAMAYPVKNYKAPQTNLTLGAYSRSQIQQTGFNPNKLSSIKLHEGVNIVLYSQSNLSGDSVVITADMSDVSTAANFQVNSWRVLGKKQDDISGKSFYLKNQRSGLSLKPSRNGTVATIYQMQPDDTDYSLWTFELVENDVYKIINKGSDRVLQVVNTPQAAYQHDGLRVIQSTYNGDSHQHFLVVKNKDGSFKLLPYSTLKYLGLPDDKQMDDKTAPVQRRTTTDNTNWLLIPAADESSVTSPSENNLFAVYPRMAYHSIHINTDLPHFSVKIVDIHGRIIHNQKNANRDLDVSAFPLGMYIMYLESETNHAVVRFIKV